MLPQAFPRKLLALLETAPAGAIAWSSDGASIVIGDRRLLVACLAEHFAHAQFASFQRQLHLYGFHKVAAEPDVYAHDHFSRARPQDVALVRRAPQATRKSRGSGARASPRAPAPKRARGASAPPGPSSALARTPNPKSRSASAPPNHDEAELTALWLELGAVDLDAIDGQPPPPPLGSPRRVPPPPPTQWKAARAVSTSDEDEDDLLRSSSMHSDDWGDLADLGFRALETDIAAIFAAGPQAAA